MARLLARSSRAFMTGALGSTNKTSQTAFSVIRDAITQDEAEVEPVRKVLKVLTMQGHLEQTGEGDTATFKLTDSGETLLNELGGK